MIDNATTAFVDSLIEAVPSLKLFYEEHIEDNDELLGHVFMGDVTRFIEELYHENSKSEYLKIIFNLFDKAFSGDNEYLQEIISLSFLENLSQDRVALIEVLI